MRITNYIPGTYLRLISFGNTDIAYRRRLLALGLVPGSKVLFVRTAPLGCPIQLEICGSAITLRKEEAQQLQWEKI